MMRIMAVLALILINGMLARLKTRNLKTYKHYKNMQIGYHNMRARGWQKASHRKARRKNEPNRRQNSSVYSDTV